ncbi:MAG: carboxymuconolactone decarboxylase family protein [Planctomycetota bacterium]|nr:MAG: carboxymuconolactone decarboxylase family protein [Planctomycetota bacterium]
MPRLKNIDPASAPGPVKEIFDGPLKGKHFNIFKAMANSTAALKAYLGLAGAVGGPDALLTAAEREVIQLVVGEANGCGYCVAAHTALGKGAGLTEEQTVAARQGSVPGDARLDALAKFTAALVEKKGWVTDEDVAALRDAGFNDGHIAEVVANFALATFTNYFNHVNETEVDFPAAPALV